MKTSHIQSIVSTLVASRGYSPICTSKELLEPAIKSYPVAWLALPELIEKEGRDSGRVTYQMELTLMQDKSLHPNMLLSALLEKMESDLIEILTLTSRADEVVEIGSISIQPSTKSITKHGDVSQRCRAKIMLYY